MELEAKGRLHFFQDEKVVNDAIDNFESVFPNDNLFVVLTHYDELKYVKPHPNTLFVKYSSPELNDIIQQTSKFKEIICHSLWNELNSILKEIQHNNITWVVWGADLYEALLEQRGYRLFVDEKLVMKVRSGRCPSWLFGRLLLIKRRTQYHKYYESLCKINSIAFSSLPTYEQFVLFFPEFSHIKVKEIFYYPIEKMLDSETKTRTVNGQDIWVNNASGYNGNHIEILKRIQSFNNIPIVHAPLSYGIKKWADYVKTKGEEILGEKFDPMLTFIPKNDYYKCFLNSNSFIFGHLRSCAFGNILMALYLGAKVFLYKENSLFEHFKRLDVVIFSINDDFNEENVMTPLTKAEIEHNRRIIGDHYSYNRLKSVLKDNFNGE